MGKIKILIIVGTRPEAVKLFSIISCLKNKEWVDLKILSTGQHKDIVEPFFKLFGINIDHNLSVMTSNQTLPSLEAKLFNKLESYIKNISPDLIIAQGDTTSVMVSAETAFYLKIPFYHIEAGLRSHNIRNPFPEEFNRVVISKVASLNFAPTKIACENLLNEGVDKDKIVITGNTVIDCLSIIKDLNNDNKRLKEKYKMIGDKKIILFTLHRRENFGDFARNILHTVKDIADKRKDVCFFYPVHPNPNIKNMAYEILEGQDNIILQEPLPYNEFVYLMQSCYMVITDSGGVQEEATFLSKPLLIIRENTERMESVNAGISKLVGSDPKIIEDNVLSLLDNRRLYDNICLSAPKNLYGDGMAYQKIVETIAKNFDVKEDSIKTDNKVKSRKTNIKNFVNYSNIKNQ